jgi:fimbrial chaperone protein
MRSNTRNFILALVAATAAVTQAAAFTFQPMIARLDPAGPGSIQTFQVSNDGDKSLAVRFAVLFRTNGPGGEEINADAGGLFTLYPARVVIEPRSSAAVKLQWNGPADILSERSFRLVAENVPLDASEPDTSGIKVLFRYIASIYVGKASFAPDLAWTVKGATGAAGAKGYSVEILNRGKRHVVADSALLSITAGKGDAVKLGAKELGVLSGANYLPGQPLRLFIPRADAVPGKTYVARFDFDAEY